MVSTRHVLFLILSATTAVPLLAQQQLQGQQPPEFPVRRFIPWGKLDATTRQYAEADLFYNQLTWNNILTASIERQPYSKIMAMLGVGGETAGDSNSNNADANTQWEVAIEAINYIAIDGATWDCWINHYTGNSWEELRDIHHVAWAYELLGWSEATWGSEDETVWPESELKFYDQLSPDERRGADRICCPAEIWDGIPISRWDFDANGVSTVQQSVLEDNTVRPAASSSSSSSSSNTTNNSPPSSVPTIKPTISPAWVRKTDAPIIMSSASIGSSVGPTLKPSRSPIIVSRPSPSPAKVVSPSARPTLALLLSAASDGTATDEPTHYVRKTDFPTHFPSNIPSSSPSSSPSSNPTIHPSDVPSLKPSLRTRSPSASPSASPSIQPSSNPTDVPTPAPSSSPSFVPSGSFFPSVAPSEHPTKSSVPSSFPTKSPTMKPTLKPTTSPSMDPTVSPSSVPSTSAPTLSPTVSPSHIPSAVPTEFVCRVHFTLVLLTDKFPVETTWSLSYLMTGEVIAKGANYQNEFQEHEEIVCLSYNTCYSFEIRDKWDDGICCDNGPGSYAGFLDYANPQSIEAAQQQSRQDGGAGGAISDVGELTPIPGLNGGAFEKSEQHNFCLDEDGLVVESFGEAIDVGKVRTKIDADRKKNTTTNNNKSNNGE